MRDINEKNYKGTIAMLDSILQHCSGTIFVTDGQGKIIYSNEASSKALGCSTEELLSLTIYDLVKRGITTNAVSIKVIREKRAMSSRVRYRDGLETIVTGDPVFNDAGELLMVVVYGQKEEIMSERIKTLEEDNTIIRQALSRIVQEDPAEGILVAESPAIQKSLAVAEKAAQLDSTIILYGESGTGKEVMARFIHRCSLRAKQIFMPVNCAAIPQELMESEFFGYNRGAFTGSNREGKLGLFEIADGGTLFLDEIGDLPLTMQSKLLRVLATGEIKRVGATNVKKVDVRIVAATNRNLKDMVSQGSFREDLYYRLNVIPISLAPLRERKEDTAAIAVHFLEQLNKKYSARKQFTQNALNVFQAYSWPGNIRELRNVIERIFVISTGDIIDTRQVSEVIQVKTDMNGSIVSEINVTLSQITDTESLQEATNKFQRAYILRVLKQCRNVTEAAKLIGIGRSGLYKKLEKLGLNGKPRWRNEI